MDIEVKRTQKSMPTTTIDAYGSLWLLTTGQVVAHVSSTLEMRRPPNLSRGPSRATRTPTASLCRCRRKTVFVLNKFSLKKCFFVFINLLAFVAATVPFPDGKIIILLQFLLNAIHGKENCHTNNVFYKILKILST